MKVVTICVENALYEFYHRVGQQAGGLPPAKAKRTKSTEKTRWQACLRMYEGSYVERRAG